MRTFAKLTMVLLAALSLAVGGCTEDNDTVSMPTGNDDARVIGTVHGVVTDAATNELMPDVLVQLTRDEEAFEMVTGPTGHYSFTDLNPGSYVLTYVWQPADDGKLAGAYGIGIDTIYIPTREEIQESQVTGDGDYYDGDDFENGPSDRPYSHEIVNNMDLFPLNGGAMGYVFDNMMNPVEGVTVVADFEHSHLSGQEFTTTTNAQGMYSWTTGLPTGMSSYYCSLRTLPYVDQSGTVFSSQSVDLDLEGGGIFAAEHLILGGPNMPYIVSANFDEDVPFLPGANFVATFNVPMDPATFAVELTWEDDGTEVPTTWSWDGTTITIDPSVDLMWGEYYYLTLAGFSAEGDVFAPGPFEIMVWDDADPVVIDRNFSEDVPFPMGDNFMVTFSVPMITTNFEVTLLPWDKDPNPTLPLTVTWNEAGTMVTVDPDQDLTEGYYQLCMYGFPVEGDNDWSECWYISTSAVPVPMAEFNYDEDRPMDLVPDPAMMVTFNVPMDPASLVIDFDGELIEYVWSADNTVLTITPVQELDEDSCYDLDIQCHSATGVQFYGSWDACTLNLMNPIVLEDNMVWNFPWDGDIIITFSHEMDPDSFEAPDGYIDLEHDGVDWPFLTDWTEGNTVLTIMPQADFNQPGADIYVELEGDAANGESLYWENDTRAFIGDAATVIWTNVLSGEGLPLTGNIEVRFSAAMDPDMVTVDLDGLYDDLHCAFTWTEGNTYLTIDPDATLRSTDAFDFIYELGIDGMTADGGPLVGGLGDMGGPFDYYTEFETVGGLQYLWSNIVRIDGSVDDFPADENIELHFNLEIDLDHPETLIWLFRIFDDGMDENDIVPIDHEPSVVASEYVDGEWTLVIDPYDDLTPGACYGIMYVVWSTIEGDYAQGVLPSDFGDEDFDGFCVPDIPVDPVELVTDVALIDDEEIVDPIDYNTTEIGLQWTRDDNADGYYIYARNVDSAKNDFFLIGSIEQPENETETTVEAMVYLNEFVGFLIDDDFPDELIEEFDSRDDDDCQTPFDGGRQIEFGVSAVQGPLERPAFEFPVIAVTEVPAEDVVAPSDGFFSIDELETADNSYDTEAIEVTFTYTASEYLDHSVEPSIMIIEGFGDDDVEDYEDLDGTGFGSPDYVADATLVDYSYEDDLDNCRTVVTFTISIPAGENGSGDYVMIDELQDTSGNLYADDEEAAYLVLPDNTAPTGGVLAQVAGTSADATLANTEVELTFTFTLPEVMNTSEDAQNAIKAALIAGTFLDVADNWDESEIGEEGIVFTDGALADPITIENVEGETVITFKLVVPVGFNGAGDLVQIASGAELALFEDLSGNDYYLVEDEEPFVETVDASAPEIVAIAAIGDMDQSGEGASTQTFEVWANELCDLTATTLVFFDEGDETLSVAEIISATPAEWNSIDQSPGDGDYTQIVLRINIPADTSVIGEQFRLEGLVDLAGNVMVNPANLEIPAP